LVVQQTALARKVLGTTGQLDVIRDLARPIRMLAVRRFLGLKNISEDTLRETMHGADSVFDFITSSRPSADQILAAERSMADLKMTLKNSELLQNTPIDQSRLLNQLTLLAVVSIFVEKAISNAMVSICEHASWEDFRQKSPPLSSLVQEALRLESPTQITSRVATRDFEWRGQSIKEGHQVSLLIGSANRDEGVFIQSQCFLVDRMGSRPLTFGLGGKRCPGEWLSSAVVEKVVQAILESGHTLRIASGGLTWAKNTESRRPVQLVIEEKASK
jgi:pimeloyl-[acyl-carrier protein] synthase